MEILWNDVLDYNWDLECKYTWNQYHFLNYQILQDRKRQPFLREGELVHFIYCNFLPVARNVILTCKNKKSYLLQSKKYIWLLFIIYLAVFMATC